MALSYGLTNPAAFKKGGGSEPTPIGYKLYYIFGGGKVAESDDFGLTWNLCNNGSILSGGSNIVYDKKNNKIVLLGGYSPYYPSSSTIYTYYATPVLNQSTTFIRGTARTRSPQGSSSYSSRYTQSGALYDFETDSLISLRVDRYHNYSTTPNYVYFITPDYLSPNTNKTVSFLRTETLNTYTNVVPADNGICLTTCWNNSTSKSIARLFRFVNNNGSYSTTTIKDFSDLGIPSGYSCYATYLKDKGFVVTYHKVSDTKTLSSFFIDFEGNKSSVRSWSSQVSASNEVYALSQDSYYANRIYLAIKKKVYYTINGTDWNTCSGQLPADAPGGSAIYAINDKIIITNENSSNNNIMVSLDNGNSFVSATLSASGYYDFARQPYQILSQADQYTIKIVPIYA